MAMSPFFALSKEKIFLKFMLTFFMSNHLLNESFWNEGQRKKNPSKRII